MVCKIGALLWRCVGWLLWNPIQVVVSNHTDFFNYRRLLKLRFFVNPFMLRENSFYGHARAVRNFGGCGFGARIEHGVFFAEDPVADSAGAFTSMTMKLFCIRRVYTFSRRRRQLVERYLDTRGLKLEVVAIGPYIQYARHFLSENAIVSLKKRLGRVLLVYPQHSIETVTCRYDLGGIIERINKARQHYDSVLVSLYWVDILHGVAGAYEAAGCTVVCAGRREDPNFLSRQKDLLTLADRVFTNSVGTHIGYAIAMDKPCTLFRQQIKVAVNENNDLSIFNASRVNTEQFYSIFSAVDGGITWEQRSLVEMFWGKKE